LPPRVGAFGSYLPYWTTLSVAVRPNTLLGQRPAAVLVLKDGTLVLGLRSAGLDIYGLDNGALNVQAQQLSEALCTLPPHTYLQTVFETGLPYDAMLEKFAAQGRAASHPLLRRGRAARYAMLQQATDLSRCEITHWIGWKGALQQAGQAQLSSVGSVLQGLGQAVGLSRSGLSEQALSPKAVQTATQLLVLAAERFVQALGGMQLRLQLLDEQQLLAACHRAINPTASAGLRPPTFVETPSDLQAYAQGEPLVLRGPALSSQLPLSSLTYDATQLTFGSPPRRYRALGIARLPQVTGPRLLHSVLYGHRTASPLRLVVTHQATDRLARKEQLEGRRRFVSNFIGRNLANHEARQAFAEYDEVMAELAQRDARLFETSVVALVSGADNYALDTATRQVTEGLAAQQVAAAPLVEQQLPAWLSTLPGYGYRGVSPSTLLDRSCAHLTPYWIPSVGDPEPDMLLHTRQGGLEALSVRPDAGREDAGAIVVGKSGSGKTFLFSHLFKYGCLDLGGHVIIVDNKGPKNSSYRPLCDMFGGAYICLQRDKDVSFNPFPPRAEALDAQGAVRPEVVAPLERILCMMAGRDRGDMDEVESCRAVARDIIAMAYLKNTQEGAPEVTLTEAVAALQHYRATAPHLQAAADKLKERLVYWLQDPTRARLFNRPEALDTSHAFTVFDFAGMDEDPALSAVLISILASRIEAKMTALPKTVPKLFAFDEAWAMFAHSPQACALLDRLYRVARSYGAFCYVLTQSYSDIADSPARGGILPNTSLIYLMRHNARHTETCALFELTPRQQELFRSLEMVTNKYAEFLLVDRNRSRTHVLRYTPTPFDIWSDSSRTADVALRQTSQVTHQESLEDTIARLARLHPWGAPKRPDEAAA
jgi:hypothetical protein